MAIEEKEQQETLLIDLIEKVEKDPIPTNIFTVEDEDPLVLLGKMNEIISKLKDIQSIVQIANTNSNEALTKAEEAVTKAIESLSTATSSNATANNALATANNALAIAQNALQLAQMADDTAVEAIDTATQLGNEAKDTATQLGNEAKDTAQQAIETATTIGNEAKSIAQNALQVAQEALSQVTQGLGTKVMDVNGNLLANAKITGHNGINVDMDEEDPETFNIRLDETITKSIEDLNTQYNTLNDHYYYLIQTTLPNINSKIETNKSNIELLQNGQADNDIAIVNLQSKTLTHDEEIANAKNNMTYLAERITATENENTRQNTHLDEIEKFTDLVDVTTSTVSNTTTYTFDLVDGFKLEIQKTIYASGGTGFIPRIYYKNATTGGDVNVFQYINSTPHFEDLQMSAWIEYYSITNKWIKFTNGVLIQWGTAKSASLFTFNQPYKDTNYILLGMSDNGDWETLWRMANCSATQGGLTSRYGNRDIRYFVVGYYK